MMKSCYWKCGRQTKNHTGICDECWRDRERIYLERNEGNRKTARIRTELQAEARENSRKRVRSARLEELAFRAGEGGSISPAMATPGEEDMDRWRQDLQQLHTHLLHTRGQFTAWKEELDTPALGSPSFPS